MDEDKLNEIIIALSGLKRYEWMKLKVAIDRVFDSASIRLELNDAESIRKKIKLEFGTFNNQ